MPYLQGIGHLSQAEYDLRMYAKQLKSEIQTALGDMGVDVHVYTIGDKLEVVVGSVYKELVREAKDSLKSYLMNRKENEPTWVRLCHATHDGFKLWASRFSDGNFNEYRSGVTIYLS